MKAQLMQEQQVKQKKYEDQVKAEYDLKYQKMNIELKTRYKEIETINENHMVTEKDYQRKLSKSVDSEYQLQKATQVHKDENAKKDRTLAQKAQEIQTKSIESEHLLKVIREEKSKFTKIDSEIRKSSQDALRKSQDEFNAQKVKLLKQLEDEKILKEKEE